MQANAYYLRCRDVDGTSVIITPTATGLGAHTRWIYEDEDDEEIAIDVDEQGDTVDDCMATPPPNTMKHVPKTPMAQHTFDAGSVICTPVKKQQPLQRSPERLGFNGIDFWHDNSHGKRIVEQTHTGPCVRYVLERPLGSATNLLKEQILEQEFKMTHATFLTQVEKLLGREERDRVMREMNQPLSAVDGSCDRGHAARQVHFGLPQPTIIIEGKEWQVYKTLRPRKDGQPRIIRSPPAKC